MGEGALFHTHTHRRSHTAVALEPCQLLRLSRKEMPKFERLAEVLLPTLRHTEQRFEARLAEIATEVSRDRFGGRLSLRSGAEEDDGAALLKLQVWTCTGLKPWPRVRTPRPYGASFADLLTARAKELSFG